jgi:hypothetical protein
MAKKTGGPADGEPERVPSGGGGKTKARKGSKSDLTADPDKIRRDLDRYREEMAEDAPASGSPEDNP